MNTQNLSSRQDFQSFSHKCKNHLRQCCPKTLTLFPCEGIINLLKGNLQSLKRNHLAIIQKKVRLLFPNEQLGSKEEILWRPKGAYSSKKSSLLPSLTVCLDMEQFDLVHASVYNKSLKTSQLQSRNFQGINLYKIPSTKLIH